MPTPVITIQSPTDTPDHWRKFVAILCFIEFYVAFVISGTHLLSDDHECLLFIGSTEFSWSALNVIRAITLYGVGWALWYDRPSLKIWIAAALIGSIATTGQLCLEGDGFMLGGLVDGYSGTLKSRILVCLLYSWRFLGWTIPLAAAAFWVRRRWSGKTRTPPWAIAAVTWCVLQVIRPLIWAEESYLYDFSLRVLSSHPQLAQLVGPVHLGIILLPGALLLSRSRFARTAALIATAANAVHVYVNWYSFPTLNKSSLRSFAAASPGADINPDVWFRWEFQVLFVDSVDLLGPWLLIAVFAWRVPMTTFPDDGSPYPRRYCGRCHYNLHGTDALRCPECGAALVTATPTPRSA